MVKVRPIGNQTPNRQYAEIDRGGRVTRYSWQVLQDGTPISQRANYRTYDNIIRTANRLKRAALTQSNTTRANRVQRIANDYLHIAGRVGGAGHVLYNTSPDPGYYRIRRGAEAENVPTARNYRAQARGSVVK